MIYSQGDYRGILEERFAERHARNPSYSLRAFARDLEISVSRLSEVLNRRNHLSGQSADQIALRLDFDDDERAYFRDLVECQTARTETLREQAQIRLLKYRFEDEEAQLSMDQFKLIADWYHFAIMELFKTKNFVCEPGKVAEILALPLDIVDEALDRLVRLQFVAKVKNQYSLIKTRTMTDCKTRSEALRRFHERVLAKAAEALGTQARSERVTIAAIGAVNKEAVAAVRADLNEVVKRFATQRTEQQDADHVYCLSVNFFRMDQKTEDAPDEPL